MNPGDVLNDYSLEITARDVDRLGATGGYLTRGTPISIAFLPHDDVDELANVAAAVRRLGFIPVPHIAARRIKSTHELVRFLTKLRETADVTRVFVIAGDLSAPLGPFDDALAIIRSGLLHSYGFHHVGITGYPEGHQQIADGNLLQAMIDKLAALADAGHSAEIVTQFLFDADTVLAWLTRLRSDGVYAPVRIGLPGPTSVQSLLRFAARCGVAVSANVMAKYGVSITRLFSTAKPDLMLNELTARIDSTAHGIVKAHLYPFGGLAKTAEWAATFAPTNPALRPSEPG